MSDQQSAYFAARSIEEGALADQSVNPMVRRAHRELAERYAARARGEAAPRRGAAGAAPALDKSEASRPQGFARFGCR